MIIAIDGPAGSGKTTIGRMLGRFLHLPVVDTGLMYRAVTVEARRLGIRVSDRAALGALAHGARIVLDTDARPQRNAALVCINGRDVTREVAAAQLAPRLAQVAQVPAVRAALVQRQRALGRHAVVMLGRDIGTIVLPRAPYKFFLTASAAERTQRRRRQLEPDLEPLMLEQEIAARDRADIERPVAPLRPAPDAIIIETEGKTVAQVFQEVLAHVPASRIGTARSRRRVTAPSRPPSARVRRAGAR